MSDERERELELYDDELWAGWDDPRGDRGEVARELAFAETDDERPVEWDDDEDAPAA